MMRGIVNDDLEPTLRLAVSNDAGERCEIDAVVDTGFNGFLTLPASVIDELNLTWLYRGPGRLADGSIGIFDVDAVTVFWDGVPRLVEAELADVQPLIGMRLLQPHVLSVHAIPGGVVKIKEFG